MGRLCRVLVSSLVCVQAFTDASSAIAGEENLWPQHPVRIDRSKQHYERLPAAQQAIDTRVWINIPARIKVLDSARFSFEGKLYRIANVHPVALKRICRDREAGRWPCGRLAGIFLGNLVRGKRLLCDVVAGDKETVLGRCQSGLRNIAAEIVAKGFGRADGDDALTSTEELARSKQVGLWRNPDCVADFDHC
jgi:endonuclease YncB( thermonuclease family)